jgi:hypothetical protein
MCGPSMNEAPLALINLLSSTRCHQPAVVNPPPVVLMSFALS